MVSNLQIMRCEIRKTYQNELKEVVSMQFEVLKEILSKMYSQKPAKVCFP